MLLFISFLPEHSSDLVFFSDEFGASSYREAGQVGWTIEGRLGVGKPAVMTWEAGGHLEMPLFRGIPLLCPISRSGKTKDGVLKETPSVSMSFYRSIAGKEFFLFPGAELSSAVGTSCCEEVPGFAWSFAR